MPSATLRINLGKDAREYLDIINTSPKFKKGRIKAKGNGKEIFLYIEAGDPKALISLINIVIKQLRVVGSVESLIKDKA